MGSMSRTQPDLWWAQYLPPPEPARMPTARVSV